MDDSDGVCNKLIENLLHIRVYYWLADKPWLKPTSEQAE